MEKLVKLNWNKKKENKLVNEVILEIEMFVSIRQQTNYSEKKKCSYMCIHFFQVSDKIS